MSSRRGPYRSDTARLSSAHPGRLGVTCWCEHTILLVDEAKIAAGKTETCGRAHCAPPGRLRGAA